MGGRKQSPIVAVVMGSDSDYPVMKDAVEVLKKFNVPIVKAVLSAHRTPEAMVEFAKTASQSGIRVIIAGAGGAAHLPGMIASLTTLPVIGVPISINALGGRDSLLSIVQMPKGVPVATVAIDGAENAALLAIQILASSNAPGDQGYAKELQALKKNLQELVKQKDRKLRQLKD